MEYDLKIKPSLDTSQLNTQLDNLNKNKADVNSSSGTSLGNNQSLNKLDITLNRLTSSLTQFQSVLNRFITVENQKNLNTQNLANLTRNPVVLNNSQAGVNMNSGVNSSFMDEMIGATFISKAITGQGNKIKPNFDFVNFQKIQKNYEKIATDYLENLRSKFVINVEEELKSFQEKIKNQNKIKNRINTAPDEGIRQLRQNAFQKFQRKKEIKNQIEFALLRQENDEFNYLQSVLAEIKFSKTFERHAWRGQQLKAAGFKPHGYNEPNPFDFLKSPMGGLIASIGIEQLGSAAYDYADKAGHKKTATAINFGKNIASMATAGFVTGGGVGAATGATIGTVMSVFQMFAKNVEEANKKLEEFQSNLDNFNKNSETFKQELDLQNAQYKLQQALDPQVFSRDRSQEKVKQLKEEQRQLEEDLQHKKSVYITNTEFLEQIKDAPNAEKEREDSINKNKTLAKEITDLTNALKTNIFEQNVYNQAITNYDAKVNQKKASLKTATDIATSFGSNEVTQEMIEDAKKQTPEKIKKSISDFKKYIKESEESISESFEKIRKIKSNFNFQNALESGDLNQLEDYESEISEEQKKITKQTSRKNLYTTLISGFKSLLEKPKEIPQQDVNTWGQIVTRFNLNSMSTLQGIGGQGQINFEGIESFQLDEMRNTNKILREINSKIDLQNKKALDDFALYA